MLKAQQQLMAALADAILQIAPNAGVWAAFEVPKQAWRRTALE